MPSRLKVPMPRTLTDEMVDVGTLALMNRIRESHNLPPLPREEFDQRDWDIYRGDARAVLEAAFRC